MNKKPSSKPGNKPLSNKPAALESKSLEFLLGECARLRRDLIALTTDSRPPPLPSSSSSLESIRIHGVVESRYRAFENSTKEEIKRLSKKSSINAQIIRPNPPRGKPPKTIKFEEAKKPKRKLSTKIIKGVDIFPELSVEKLKSFEFVQARPKSNVGYYHFISQQDDQRSYYPSPPNRSSLVVQTVNNINILPEEMKKLSTTENSDELEEGSLKSSSKSSSVVDWHNTSFEEEGDSSRLVAEKSKEDEGDDISPRLLSTGSEDHSRKSTSSASSQGKTDLTEFLQTADKTLIEKLPLDEKMKIIRRNLRSYEESLNEECNSSAAEEDPKEEEEEEELSTGSLCDFLRYALSGKEESGKSYLSTIEERTENESSSLARRSLKEELSRTTMDGDLHLSYDRKGATTDDPLSEGQFLQEGSLDQEDGTEIDDDDSSTDTFIISTGEWS